MITDVQKKIYLNSFFDKTYHWKLESNKDFILFKFLKFSDINDEVYVELLDYRYQGVSKKMVESFIINQVFMARIRILLESDFKLCSISDYSINIINKDKFILPEKRKSSQSEFKIYTGYKGYDSLRQSSYLFNDDRDDDLMLYERLLGTNRFR